MIEKRKAFMSPSLRLWCFILGRASVVGALLAWANNAPAIWFVVILLGPLGLALSWGTVSQTRIN
jgi:hypothetical protein